MFLYRIAVGAWEFEEEEIGKKIRDYREVKQAGITKVSGSRRLLRARGAYVLISMPSV